MLKRSVSILLALMLLGGIHAQEFRCAVSINYQKLMTTTQSYESSDKKVFDNMKQALEDFINSRRWTSLEMDMNERLDCSLSLILSERTSATDFKGQISIQLRRPVYNSNYTTGLFNYIESGNMSFVYNDSQPLDYDPNTFFGDLSSVVSYYLYILLGVYFDSYGPNGGEPFFEMANTICQTASQQRQDAGQGWNSRGSTKVRYWFVENHTNSAYSGLHDAYYMYHRMGLDMMTKDQPQARQNIISALRSLQQVHKARPNILSVQHFMDVKITELVSIFTPAPADEQKQVYDIVKEISPNNVAKLKDFATK